MIVWRAICRGRHRARARGERVSRRGARTQKAHVTSLKEERARSFSVSGKARAADARRFVPV